MLKYQSKVQVFNDRCDIIVPGDFDQTIQFGVDQLIEISNASIKNHGYFSLALSGGSTPKAIYKKLSSAENRTKIDWSKVLLFWSDERSVPLTDKESNYHMAMEAGFASLPLKPENIFPMKTDNGIEKNALDYEELIQTRIPNNTFDAVLLGMGEDGHTASLFPKTHGLKAENRLVIANFIPQKDTWRMTLTYDCINSAHYINIYVLGKSKAEMVTNVLNGPYQPDILPIQKIGTPEHRALWILDKDAASLLPEVD